MKKIRTILSLLLAAALCLSLAACGPKRPVSESGAPQTERPETTASDSGREDPAEPASGRTELLRMTITSVSRQNGGEEETNVQTLEYGEDGLVTAHTSRIGETTRQIRVHYLRNEQGDPVGFDLGGGEEAVSAVLENRYENGRITEAVLSDLSLNGESLQASGALEAPSMAILAEINVVVQFLQRYAGYADCTLRVAGTETGFRSEGGRTVFSSVDYGATLQETSTEYLADGSTRGTVRTWQKQDGTRTLLSGSSSLTDAKGLDLETTLSTEKGEVGLTYRYEEGEDPVSGEKTLTAYFDEISLSEGMEQEEDLAQEMAELRNAPITRFVLNEAGRVIRREQTEEYAALLGGQRTVIQYDDAGRPIRQETVVDQGSVFLSNTTEYEYRP